MKTIKINNFEIELGDRGIVTLKEGKNEIFLGNYQGNRFETLLQVLKTAKELGYLSELDNSPSQQTSVDKREVGTIIKETSDAGVNPVSDTNEEKIKSEPTVAELHKRELYKGIRAVNPQDGGQHGN